jgi:hypothetical protein
VTLLNLRVLEHGIELWWAQTSLILSSRWPFLQVSEGTMSKAPVTKAEKPAKAESHTYNWRTRKNLKRGTC